LGGTNAYRPRSRFARRRVAVEDRIGLAALVLSAVAVVEKPFLADRLREAIAQVLNSK
jgi:hypothetical protein